MHLILKFIKMEITKKGEIYKKVYEGKKLYFTCCFCKTEFNCFQSECIVKSTEHNILQVYKVDTNQYVSIASTKCPLCYSNVEIYFDN